MTRPPPCVARVSVGLLRPDRDASLLDDSACVVRIGIDLVGDEQEDTLKAPADEASIMFSTAAPLTLNLLRGALRTRRVLRIDIGNRDLSPWDWPLWCRDESRAEAALHEVAAQHGQLPPSAFFPLMIWAIPEVSEYVHNLLVEEYRDAPQDWGLWRDIVRADIIRLAVTETTISLACHCRNIEEVTEIVRQSVVCCPWPVEWYS